MQQPTIPPFSQSHPLEEPLLCFPHRYLALLDEIPQTPRALRPVKPAKRKAYLTLAGLILQKVPTESTARSVRFLVGLINDMTPQPVPRLPWIQEEVHADDVVVGLPPAIGRLWPGMKFIARLRA